MPGESYDQDWEEFLELISSMGGLIPVSYWEILKIARVLFSQENKVSDALRPSFASLMEAPPQTKEHELISKDIVVFNYNDPEPALRRIKGVEELNLVDSTTLAMEDFSDLLIQSEERKLHVRIMDPREHREKKDEIKPVRNSLSGQRLNMAAQKSDRALRAAIKGDMPGGEARIHFKPPP